MKQKVEEIIIELSMLNDDFRDTQRIIDEKKFDLLSICPHEKLTCNVQMVGRPVSEEFPRGLYVYKCLVCGFSESSNGTNPELDESVINE